MSNTIEQQQNEATKLASEYVGYTDAQHILEEPGMWIGSIDMMDDKVQTWVLEYAAPTTMPSTPSTPSVGQEQHVVEAKRAVPIARAVLKPIQYIPALYQLFEEAIMNCLDHATRMRRNPEYNQVSYIHITIAPDGTITLENDGNGIDIAEHPEYKKWIPELCFSNPKFSTNYNKNNRDTGGKNGVGIKAVIIWSSYAHIETVDHVRGLKYTQTFRNNLNVIDPPVIVKHKGKKPYTRLTFKPDFARMNSASSNTYGLNPDIISLMNRRCYDIAAIAGSKGIKVKLNDELIQVKNFPQYIDLYIGNKTETERIYESPNDDWEYAISMTPSRKFQQISFVNGVNTYMGGTHVDYIMKQICDKIVSYIQVKKKIEVKPQSIKQQLMLFLRCRVLTPDFEGQNKSLLKTPRTKYGTDVIVSDKFIDKIIKLGVVDVACKLDEIKDLKEATKTETMMRKKIVRIEKYDGAEYAGTEQSHKCTIIWTEGDSAKSGVLSGLTAEDRKYIGIYPLRGKIFNTRGESLKTINSKELLTNMKQILGLEIGKEYKTWDDVKTHLRYGKIAIMTDADHDGTHIKGLNVNFIETLWPSLFELDGFMGSFNTPVVKATKGDKVEQFINLHQYELWKEKMGDGANSWKIKYYKGLGTSTATEFKEYMRNRQFVGFKYAGQSSHEVVDMAFNSERADDRKKWLENYDPNVYADTTQTELTYDDFVKKELVHYSKHSCDRGIPNLMDGLKPSLRKILFCALRQNINDEIKVSQFAGDVAKLTEYHHGEMAMTAAIIGMAQTFVGANNIQLLEPCGQFGTRLLGGDDAAAPRYVFTKLNPLTRLIYSPLDDAKLTYLNEEGKNIEPEYYVPIIPMCLINGAQGMGTGTSTSIPCFHPLEIVKGLRNMLNDTPNDAKYTPYYRGFKGSIVSLDDNDTKFLVKGCYVKQDERTIVITELPVGSWTEPFKNFLKDIQDYTLDDVNLKTGKVVKHKENEKSAAKSPKLIESTKDSGCTDKHVYCVITFAKEEYLTQLESSATTHGCNALEKLFGLYTTISTTNMHMFDDKIQLRKYASVSEIMGAYIPVRLRYYEMRKDYLIRLYTEQLVQYSNKMRFMNEILNDSIDLRRKTNGEITDMLTTRKYDKIDDKYDYLVHLPMNSVSVENVDKIKKQYEAKQLQLDTVKETTTTQMWNSDLDAFIVGYDEMMARYELDNKDDEPKQQEPKHGKVVKKVGDGVKVKRVVKKAQEPTLVVEQPKPVCPPTPKRPAPKPPTASANANP